MLPSLLSTLLTSTLPGTHSKHLRVLSAQTMSRIITQYSTTYPSLAPRVVKTLLLALLSPGKSLGTREGAIRGLMGVGDEAIRKGLVESGGIKLIGEEAPLSNQSPVATELRAALSEAIAILAPESSEPQMLDHENPDDVALVDELKNVLGVHYGPIFLADRVRAQKILGRTPS
jgi:transcription initiation factor TFIID subunit 6